MIYAMINELGGCTLYGFGSCGWFAFGQFIGPVLEP